MKTALMAFLGWLFISRVSYFSALTVQELFAPYFLTADGYQSTLVIKNQRRDVALTVVPSLVRADGTELELGPVVIAPSSSTLIDVNQELVSRGVVIPAGGVVIRHGFPSAGAVVADVLVNHPERRLSLKSLAQARQEFMSSELDGVFWIPTAVSDVRVALQNTTDMAIQVSPTLRVGVSSSALDTIAVLPHRTVFFDVAAHLSEISPPFSGALHLASSGAHGALMAEGWVVDVNDAYSKRIAFADTSLMYPDDVLRAQLFLLGKPPRELGFPRGADFDATVAIHNTDPDQVAQVALRVRYIEGNVRVVDLPGIALAPGEVRTVDFTGMQRHGLIPRSFSAGTLELESRGVPNRVIAELTDWDRATGYVVGSSFTAHPVGKYSGILWRADTRWQSLVTVTNAAARDDEVQVELWGGGESYHLPSIHLASGGLATINLRELRRREGIPVASLGTISVSGSHGVSSALVVDRLVFDTSSAQCLDPGGGNEHNYVDAIDSYSPTPPSEPPSDPPESTESTFLLQTTGFWNDGQETDVTGNTTYSSRDTSIVQTFNTAPKRGVVSYSATSSGSVIIDSDYWGVACIHGSWGHVYEVTTPILKVEIKASSYYNSGVTPAELCEWRKTCDGTCTESPHYANKVNGYCYTMGRVYKQCTDVVLNGACWDRRRACLGMIAPGICS